MGMETNQNLPEWMTADELAAEMRVSGPTVRRWVATGIIPAHCIRRAQNTLRINRDALRYFQPNQGDTHGTHDEAGTAAR